MHKDFIQAFEIFTDDPLIDSLPESFDTSLGSVHVLDMFKQTFKEAIMEEGGFLEPENMGEELWGNDPKAIYLAGLSIDMNVICNLYYSNLKQPDPYLCLLFYHCQLTYFILS